MHEPLPTSPPDKIVQQHSAFMSVATQLFGDGLLGAQLESSAGNDPASGN